MSDQVLRNLDASAGLCNGTRLIQVRHTPRVLEAKTMTGSHAGQVALIPRIPLDTGANANLSFCLRRFQFPVRVAFAMTVNKSQGQSLAHVGLHFESEVFFHGQLYVALSRGRSKRNIRVFLGDSAPAT